jgi:YYY domain-containing protein
MSWLLTTLWWYFFLLVLGVIFIPLTRKIFNDFFFDWGYPFAKTLAILFLSYSIFCLGTLKLLPFYQESLLLLLLLFLALNIFFHKNFRQSLFNKKQNRNKIILIIFEEILFFISLCFWVYVRGQEPSIRGLEKFMDFGFINSILRAKYFPPLDIWLSGKTINYYYFGHLTGATLIKLTGIASEKGYNLILATIFALVITKTFSLSFNLVYNSFKRIKYSIVAGFLGSFLVNFGGNLHTIYAFTKGYPNENPVPFWQILSGFNPSKYWYPNATRFIPFTIHEFPIYSYVVADLHGHVFDIPFVLLTIAVLFLVFTHSHHKKINGRQKISNFKFLISKQFPNFQFPIFKKLFSTNSNYFQLILTVFLGFLTTVHYMTNAFDGPIYVLLTSIILLLRFRMTPSFFVNFLLLITSFFLFSLPFSTNFKPFITGIGVNCSPQFLVTLGKVGPFLFEKGNCQVSPPWMIFILWGFFWLNFIFLAIFLYFKKKSINNIAIEQPALASGRLNNFILILFIFGTSLIIIPEFFYIKDIYPAHFRANTMFKLGYQAFMMMGVASSYVFILFKHYRFWTKQKQLPIFSVCQQLGYFFIFIFLFFFVALYPTFAVPSYYGKLDKIPELSGSKWIASRYLEYKEIIDYLNSNVNGQPTILEAQGDSYTDFNIVSAYTGLPTVAGWWVHEWLWRGSANAVGKIIPDIQNIYESEDLTLTKRLIGKYQIKYLIIGSNEREKYKNLKEEKFEKIGQLTFLSSNKQGKIFVF